MINNNSECPFCSGEAESGYYGKKHFYVCPNCGRFMIQDEDISRINKDHFASYLFYHAYQTADPSEKRYYDINLTDKSKRNTTKEDLNGSEDLYLDSDMVEAWYPRSFAERIDMALLYLHDHSGVIGDVLYCTLEQIYSMLFIIRSSFETSNVSEVAQTDFILDYMRGQNYISTRTTSSEVFIQLKPEGYKRLDELLKDRSFNKTVFVAMKYGEETKKIREAIRKAIKKAGYEPIIEDEVPNNGLIVPEMLKHIRDSRFLVVDLTDESNGAYFEEGYAMGLGKPIIQICQETKLNNLHFDIAQVNTLTWENENDLINKLEKRIKATIE